jgi:hypothetical protein
MVRRRTGSLLGAFYVLVGAALLGSALFAPWYFYDGQYTRWCGSDFCTVGPRDATFSLVSFPGNEPVQTSCPGWYAPDFCPLSASYSGAGLNSTGQVAALTSVLATAGFAVAAFSGVLGVILRKSTRWTSPVLALAVVAVALALAATVAFAVLLPGAFAHDIPASQRTFAPSGPWSSFYGSATLRLVFPCPNPAGCPPIIASWGPSMGWALSAAAIPILFVGVAMLVRFQHDVAELRPSSTSTGHASASKTKESAT